MVATEYKPNPGDPATTAPQRRRHLAARQNLLKVRRQGAALMYFELGPQRSLAKLMPLFRERFGSVSMRTLAQWSSEDKWVDRALQYDREHAVSVLERAHEMLDVSKIDTIEALEIIAKKYLDLAMRAAITIRNEQGLKAVVQSIADLMKLREMLIEAQNDVSRTLKFGQKTMSEHFGATTQVVAALAVIEARLRAGKPLMLSAEDAQEIPKVLDAVALPDEALDATAPACSVVDMHGATFRREHSDEHRRALSP
jgi:hypothetical protein